MREVMEGRMVALEEDRIGWGWVVPVLGMGIFLILVRLCYLMGQQIGEML